MTPNPRQSPITEAGVDLIARLEAATEGSRELDCLIHVAVHGWKLARIGPDAHGENASEFYTPTGELFDGFSYPPIGQIDRFYHVPQRDTAYTASLDAAATLVPNGFKFYVANEVDYGHACAWRDGSKISGGCTDIATPALALCIAALRARAALPAAPDAGGEG